MSNRYLVQIITSTITPVIVVADSETEAQERALKGEGNPSQEWKEEAEIRTTTKLEG